MEGEDTNPFDTGVDNPGVDDGDGIELEPYDASSRRGSKDTGHPPMTNTSHHRMHEETSFMEGANEHSPLIRRESSMGEAWDSILEKYPKANTANSSFTARTDKYGRVEVRLKRLGGRYHLLFDANDEVNEKLPVTIRKSLGPTAEEIAVANEEEITSRSAKLGELRSALETADENQREDLNRRIVEQEDEIDGLERENEAVEQHMPLRDRIKAIFKKYGFTLIGVLTAVGTVIGVIVSNLKQGLTTLGKGVGDALKSIGKKLGEILPGLVGAIASFIFKTAGEVIGFLGKNAWLLIVGVVVFLIERLKKNSR